jgi:hypothetical protein
MFSGTEERLRLFVEKTASALTEEVRVEVRPGDAWASYPGSSPPMLVYRLTDVAVIGDEIVAVTAHEIAHLLYTQESVKWPFDVGKFPRSARLLLNAVEDSRIERLFSDDFPGARSLFDQKLSVGYDGKVQRGFGDLPIKWRFLLNIDRVLHGLEPWGDARDIDAVDKALDACLLGMWADTTQECTSHLEIPFRIMVELIRNEAKEKTDSALTIPDHLKLPPAMIPPDYMANAPSADEGEGGSKSDRSAAGAEQDDGKPGGEDGTPGSRAEGKGPKGKGEGKSGEGASGSGSGEEKGAGGSGAGGSGAGKIDTDAWDGFGDPNDASLPAEPPLGATEPAAKPMNIIEEMVNEQKALGSKNKTIDVLSFRQRLRAKDTKEVEKRIEAEKDAYWKQIAEVFGKTGVSKALEARVTKNLEIVRKDIADLELEIRTLRSYARMVLRDNGTARFSGSYTSGRRIKTHRLYRLESDNPRIMERKEAIGGKSYSIAVVVDQSSSMAGGGRQELAYKSALVFLKAFEGLIDTSVIGFSEAYGDPIMHAVAARRSRPYGYPSRASQGYMWRTYKSSERTLDERLAMIPELGRSYASTPMEYGVTAAIEQLKSSDKEVRAMLLITDGAPNDSTLAAAKLAEARRLGIQTFALYIGGRSAGSDYSAPSAGFKFLLDNCDHAVEVRGVASIPTSVYAVLRNIVRRRMAAV